MRTLFRRAASFNFVAAAGAVAAVGAVERVMAVRADSLVDRVARVLVDTTPLPLVEEGIRLLGTTDKPAIRLQVVGGAAAVAGAVARRGSSRPGLAATLAAGGVLGYLDARRVLAGKERETNARRAGVTVAQPLPDVTDGAESWAGAEPLYTDEWGFYRTDVNPRAPLVDLDEWRLEVVGPDGSSGRLSAADLAALPARERDHVLVCIHNRLGWDRLGHQRWTGVSIPEVLEVAGVEMPAAPDEFDLVMEAVDGYFQTLPVSEALSRDSWVVWGMGRRQLSAGHGFPARVLTPGLAGQYNGVKWLSRLRVVPSGSVRATWVRRGWPTGPIEPPPMSRIDHPGQVAMPPRLPQRRVVVEPSTTLVGTAWAVAHGGVADVQVRIDGGEWQSAELASNLGPHSWRRWRAPLQLSEGEHRAEVRCITADGTVQEGNPSAPFPYGATGLHGVDLLVRAG